MLPRARDAARVRLRRRRLFGILGCDTMTLRGVLLLRTEEQPEPAKKKPKASSWVLPTKKTEAREKLQTGGVKAGQQPVKVPPQRVSVVACCLRVACAVLCAVSLLAAPRLP